MVAPPLHRFAWRYFTGHHLDGKARTDAGWFRRGTKPEHHVNWWTGKPRVHRMLWRWALVGIPSAWLLAVHYAPVWRVNLAVVVSVAVLPYLAHHGAMRFISLLPRARVVSVVNHVIPEDDVSELDDVTLTESSMVLEDISELDDYDASNLDDIVKATKPRRRKVT
jgi:hypothetical protein